MKFIWKRKSISIRKVVSSKFWDGGADFEIAAHNFWEANFDSMSCFDSSQRKDSVLQIIFFVI